MSLAELLVATALAGVVLLTGTVLLVRLAHEAEREIGRAPLVGGEVELALDLIARDLAHAVALPLFAGELRADRDTLVLEMRDGSVVVYDREGNRLVRATRTADEVEYRRRVLVDGLAVADFAPRGAGTVDCWLRADGEESHLRTVLLRNRGRRSPASEDRS